MFKGTFKSQREKAIAAIDNHMQQEIDKLQKKCIKDKLLAEELIVIDSLNTLISNITNVRDFLSDENSSGRYNPEKIFSIVDRMAWLMTKIDFEK